MNIVLRVSVHQGVKVDTGCVPGVCENSNDCIQEREKHTLKLQCVVSGISISLACMPVVGEKATVVHWSDCNTSIIAHYLLL